MAATVNTNKVIGMVPYLLNDIKLSGLTAGATEVLSHNGPRGVAPDEIDLEVTTPPTDGSGVKWSHTADSTTNNTSSIKFDTDAGGSLSGALVTVHLKWLAQASGGLAAPF